MQDLLPHIHCPDDIKKCSIPELAHLARELREFIINTLSETGGHLAPSLGVVELTLVLHYLYNAPEDKIVWDVGHQSYVHKIITGRRDLFNTIRQHGGLSGFPKISESEYDSFGVGHASTAISAAMGMAVARDLADEKNHVVAIVGDGALTGGLSFEGLNNVGASGKNIVVVLNDNSMSISPNVGAIATYLTNIISNPLYNRIKSEIWNMTGRFDRLGERIRFAARRLEESLKNFVMPGLLFERLGLRYFGPIDGHNISALIHLFQEVKKFNGPILVHVLTKKGRGYKPAEENAPVFHGLGRFDRKTGRTISESSEPTYTKVFGHTLTQLAETHPKLTAITAAMAIGTGLTEFSIKYPKRFFDVGIAEGHAVTFAAGMASQGFRPVVAIYSSFLQRSYDHVIHDIALQNFPVIFAIDRAGLVGDDGPTHHGVFDIAFLRHIPNMVVMVPKDEEELRHMLHTSMLYTKGPVAIRYPRGTAEGVEMTLSFKEIPIGAAEIVRKGKDAVMLAIGPMVYRALEAAAILDQEDGISVQVVNARFVKPLDTDMLDQIFNSYDCILSCEEGVLAGGFGAAIAEKLSDLNLTGKELIRCGLPDHFIEHGNRAVLLDEHGLSVRGLVDRVRRSSMARQKKLSLPQNKELKSA